MSFKIDALELGVKYPSHTWLLGSCICLCCGKPFCVLHSECLTKIEKDACKDFFWYQILHGTKKYREGKWV